MTNIQPLYTTVESVTSDENTDIDTLCQNFIDRKAKIGVVGLGYVGLPLVNAVCDEGFVAVGFDVDRSKIDKLNGGQSYIGAVSDKKVKGFVDDHKFIATDDFTKLGEVDAILMCVPTPLTQYREPDLSYVVNTTKAIAPYLRKGQLIILESTTYPGTMRDVVKPILEETGLISGEDFYLAYSPEREDPGNPDFSTSTIPKVVGGDGADALRLSKTMYDQFLDTTVPVSTAEVAEAVKLTENIFRSVNIALVNELKVIYDALDIDVWEVINAASTKPFGYMPFYPGPGLGGHCIPIDPFYLSWKAREHDISTRFIELAGEINIAMPQYVVNKLAESLDRKFAKGLNGSKILVLGVAYKKNVVDTRESPSFAVLELLKDRNADYRFHDPYVAEIPQMREHAAFVGMKSVDLTPELLAEQDAVIIVTDHDNVDYDFVVKNSKLVIDTRNVTVDIEDINGCIVKA